MIKKILSVFVVGLLATQGAFAQAQIPNGSFENWTGGNPNSWGSSDAVVTAIPGQSDPGGVEKDTVPANVYSGHSSVRLTSKELNILGTGARVIPGVVNLGTISLNFSTFSPEITGYSYSDRPDSIGFAAKYTKAAGSTDTGAVVVTLTRWDATNGTQVVANTIVRVSDVSTFKVFSAKIKYYSALTPDTLLVQGLSVLSQTGADGSVMWLDTVAVTGLDTAFKAYIVPFAPTTACSGDTVQFATDFIAGNTYQWFNGATPVFGATSSSFNATAAGNYSVQVIRNSTTYTSDTVALTYTQRPTVTLAIPVDTFCSSGAAVTLTGGSPTGGDYSGTGVANNHFNPNTAGAGTHPVTYVYTDANGCSANASQNLVVKVCTGIETVEAGWSVNMYPNPAGSTLMLETDARLNGGTFEAYDLQGRQVMKETISNTTLSLNVKNLAAGTYTVRLVNSAKLTVANAKINIAH